MNCMNCHHDNNNNNNNNNNKCSSHVSVIINNSYKVVPVYNVPIIICEKCGSQ